MQPTFIHLRLHTEFSIQNGLIRIEDLIAAAVKFHMPAVAITDHMNLFAAVKFYQAALDAGIKPILGADCWFENPINPKQPFRLTLLCQNYQGYQNLTRLISRAYLQGRQLSEIPLLKKEWLKGAVDGLIALSGAIEGEIAQALLMGKPEQASELLKEWLGLFPDRFYLELLRTGRPQDEINLKAAIALAKTSNVPVLATNGVLFINKDDFEAHEARVCIQSGHSLHDPRRPRLYSPEQYFRSPEEMQILFKDYPEALTNTVEVAKRCNLELSLGKTFLPNFPVPDGLSIEVYLAQETQEGLKQRSLLAPWMKGQEQLYQDRLKFELNVINSMGFAGYFLIVADFIRWAKQNEIPVGPGRGSGAGSLVAYALRITDLDPLQFDLLFERFLNPERVSMPDFDIDFCMDGRDRVIEYVAERYGRDAVSQIITFGSMAAKAVIRDVGRVLGYPYGMVDKLAKLIPFEIGITLEKALAQEDELAQRYSKEDEVRVLMDLAKKLEGLVRNVGKHAAGVVIAPSRLTDFTPLYCESNGENLVTQFDMDDIQTVGLVKFDFLGLRTLTIIDWAVRTINSRLKNLEAAINIEQIPLDDAATFTLLKNCATTAIFQLESRGMKDLVKRLKPDCLEDVIALVALFRPGPLQSGMVDDFINRKHGKARVEYMHPLLEPILRPTYGIILYQEQVMQIAQVLAGYTLGAADLLRRAMGKKKVEEMAKQRAIFVEGAKSRSITEEVATNIFNLMEKFADYGFNRSHSAAYALVSYQTAWLKAHYPAEFMAAVLSSDMHHTDKVVALLEECRLMKLKLLPPNINQGQFKFTIDDQGAIVYGLGAIKGMGEAAVDAIIAARKSGVFKNIFELCQRVDARKVNRRVLEVLIRSGSLDGLGTNRASLVASLDLALQTALQNFQAKQGGQGDLFGDSYSNDDLQTQMIQLEEWPIEERLLYEKETLGFYLNGHPLQKYENELVQFVSAKLQELDPHQHRSVVVAGWVVSLRSLYTKRGDRMAILTLEDRSGRLELAVFSEAYSTYKDLLIKDQLLIVEGEISIDEFTGNHKLMARKILNIDQAREYYGKELILHVAAEKVTLKILEDLKEFLVPFCGGGCPVSIKYSQLENQVDLALDENWRVTPTEVLFTGLRKMFGLEAVEMIY